MKAKLPRNKAVTAILLVVLLAVLASLAWTYFFKQDKNPATQTAQENQTQPMQNDRREGVPEGYLYYQNEVALFSIAYPEGWGSLERARESSGDTKVFDYQESKPTGALAPVKVTVSDVRQYEISTGQGGKLAFDNNEWKLVSIGGVAGNVPTGTVVPIPSKKFGDLTVHEVMAPSDRDLTLNWVFQVRDRMVTIAFPTACGGEECGEDKLKIEALQAELEKIGPTIKLL